MLVDLQIKTRQDLAILLKSNPGVIILKFGAEWCGPCKQIEPLVHAYMSSSPPEIMCLKIDIDVSFDLYAFLKSKKIVNGIPVILAYKQGNEHYVPDDVVIGTDPVKIHAFFKNAKSELGF